MKKLTLLLLLSLISCKKYFEVEPKTRLINTEMTAIIDRFKYYIDLGTGYQEVEIYDNKLEFLAKKEADISYRLKAEELDGQCTFKGTIASQLYAKKTTEYYLPFKITNTYDAVENTLIECNLDVRSGDYDPTTETLEISKFVKAGQTHDKLIAGYDVKYNVLDFSPSLSQYTLFKGITSTNVSYDNIEEPTTMAWSSYKMQYDVNGNNTGSGDPYDRWQFMLLTNTVDEGGGNYVYTWQTMYFDFMPGTESDTNGYTEVVWSNSKGKRWLKLPTSAGQTETFTADYTELAYRLDEILDYIIQGLDGDLSLIPFSPFGTTLSRFRLSSTYVCNTSELNGANIDKIEFSLKDIFDYIKYYYGGEWYIDEGVVKFDDYPYIYSEATIDWSSEVQNRKIINAYDPMPDKEIWSMADKNIDSLQIGYFDKGIVTDNNNFDYSVDYYADLAYLKENGCDNNLIVLFTASMTVGITTTSMFGLVVKHALYSENLTDGIFFIGSNPADPYLKIAADVGSRPLWKTEHQKTLLDYSTFNIFSKITGMGYIDNYKINLKTGVGTFTCFGKSADIN